MPRKSVTPRGVEHPRVGVSSFIRLLSGSPSSFFSRDAIQHFPILVCKGDGMTAGGRHRNSVMPQGVEHSTAVPATPACAHPQAPAGDLLLRTFTNLRDELVSTLCFLLGNAEDAQ